MRVPRKNIRMLGGHPLIAYTIAAAKRAMTWVYVSTDDEQVRRVACKYGAIVIDRPTEYATDLSPDIEWITHFFQAIKGTPHEPIAGIDAFAILRPTSPFRTTATIQRALDRFDEVGFDCDSLRAMEPVRQSPYKMWVCHERKNASNPTIWATPFMEDQGYGVPRHSSPSQTHPHVYVQNGSLEIAWRSTIERTGTIAGEKVIPFFTNDYEGFDLNSMEDWCLAETMIERGIWKLPEVGEK